MPTDPLTPSALATALGETAPAGIRKKMIFKSEWLAQALPLLLRQYPTPRMPSFRRPDLAVYGWDGCDPAWLTRLQALARDLDCRDPALCPPETYRLLQLLQLHGAKAVARRASRSQGHPDPLKFFQILCAELVGSVVLRAGGERGLMMAFPPHFFSVIPQRARGFVLVGYSLQALADVAGGVAYLAEPSQSVSLHGVTRRVAWTPHALTRIQERCLSSGTDPLSRFIGWECLTTLIQHTLLMRSSRLYPQQEAVALYQPCAPGTFSWRYVEELLPTPDPTRHYAYLMGYCPIHRTADYYLAKTCLPPGYVGTPEYGRVYTGSFDPGVKEQLLARCAAYSRDTLADTEDFGLVRWFHTHGVPQLITYAREAEDATQ